MTLYKTPEDAATDVLCLLSRTFGTDPLSAHCRGPECAVWRWKPRLPTDQGYISAIKREKILLANEQLVDGQRKKTPEAFHKQAVAAVSRNPEGYGIERTEGYCGFGGPVT